MSANVAGTRRTKTETVDGVTITAVELDYCSATDLLPELLAAVGQAGGMFSGELNVGEAIAACARELVGGKLTGILHRLLVGTTLVFPGVGKVDIVSRETMNLAFTGRKKYALPAVKLAMEVNFADFLDGLALIGVRLPAMAMVPSPSAASPPSTTATG